MPYQKKLVRNYNPANRLPVEKIQLIVNLHLEGKSQREIKEITGFGVSVIRKYTAGYERNPNHCRFRKSYGNNPIDPSPEEIAERAREVRLTWGGIWDDDSRDSE